ncbi:siderophore ABC transporter substrate-binding protein [Haematomicrobium sanguinis]|uniref:siderophore ABC transporter substrate-binding protein n=1 Tax=Haematomicrobium sanguinis TaxID=479106 RepID=UPI00054D50E8|nr:ABC transporter substrate-binding protein [Haematomicrobium sanguinis]
MGNLKRRHALAAGLAVAALALAGCGATNSAEAGSTGESAKTVSITDNAGTQQIPADPQKVIATDNHIFRTLEAWDVPLVAAPKKIMPKDLNYVSDQNVVDLGNHRSPDLEALVAAEPDLILNGYRFESQAEKIKELAPDAAIVDFAPRDGKDLGSELKRQISALGDIFGKQDAATELNASYDDAVAKAKDAYNGTDTVMGLITSGGDISYAAPSSGRSVGPVFDALGLKPALEQTAQDSSHGDDISVEAIANANPDWLIVLDRAAALGENSAGAKELLTTSEALKDVPAIKNNQIIYLDPQFYLTEDIQAYTGLYQDIASAFSNAA